MLHAENQQLDIATVTHKSGTLVWVVDVGLNDNRTIELFNSGWAALQRADDIRQGKTTKGVLAHRLAKLDGC